MELREAADVRTATLDIINRLGLPICRAAELAGVDASTVRRWIWGNSAPSLVAWADLLDAAGAKMWLCWRTQDALIANQGPITTPEGLIGALVDLIRGRGITLADAAAAAGLGVGAISRWRHGKLGVKLTDLVEAVRGQGAWLQLEVSA